MTNDFTTAEHDEFEHEEAIAEGLFEDMLETSEAEDCCAVCVAIALFVGLTQFMTSVGWTSRDLHALVAAHSEDDGGSVH